MDKTYKFEEGKHIDIEQTDKADLKKIIGFRQDLNVIDEIIDIYNGKCESYEDYQRKVESSEHYWYYKGIAKEFYDYIVEKGKKDGRQ